MMLRLALHLLSVIFAIRGTLSQENCCEKKTVNDVEYELTQDEVASNPSCVNGCIYQEVGNPSSYACFVDAFNEDGCSVDVDQSSTCSSCNKGSEDYVISGESHNDEWFPVKNVLTWSIPEVRLGLHGDIGANYWLAPLGTQSHFILKFDQPRTVDTITLVNTFNDEARNSGTNEFKVYIGETESGPWTEVLHDHLEDARDTNQNINSVPAKQFSINPTCGKFVKFQIISWYGVTGGLQYFSTCQLKCNEAEGWEPHKNKCFKTFSTENDISWMDANFNCNNERGQLASIPNEETNDFLKTVSASERTIIGGFATGQAPNPDLWTWTDGTPWSYMNWAPDRPNNEGAGGMQEYCLEMNRDQDQIGEWNDVVCHDSYATSYICQKYPTY